jgi:hypothetical protein
MTTNEFCNCGIPLQTHDGSCSRCKKTIPAHRLKTVASDAGISTHSGNSFHGKSSADIAINSARIVNGYGLFIQVAGSILAGIILILGFAQPGVYPKSSITTLTCTAVAVALILAYLVFGAFFRMISNYIIARLEK